MRGFLFCSLTLLLACTGGSDAGPDLAAPACLLANGSVCGRPEAPHFGCPGGYCNWCACGGDFSAVGTPACTQIACFTPDAGTRPAGAPALPACRDTADCPSGMACIHNPGCKSDFGVCNLGNDRYCELKPTNLTICDCTGNTITITVSSCAPDRPYRYSGACK